MYTLSETNSLPLKSGDWKTILPFLLGRPSFTCFMSVPGFFHPRKQTWNLEIVQREKGETSTQTTQFWDSMFGFGGCITWLVVSMIFLSSPLYTWENGSNLTFAYFSKGLVQPPTSSPQNHPTLKILKMDGLQWKTLLKWMIWGYHYLQLYVFPALLLESLRLVIAIGFPCNWRLEEMGNK